MAHHGTEFSDEMRAEALRLTLGPTGRYPMGKMSEEDAGEIAIGIAADLNNDVVIINLGTRTAWLGLTVEQAKSIGSTLIAKAMELQTTARTLKGPAGR